MTLPVPQPKRPDPSGHRELAREFYCRPRRRRLSLDRCLDDYMMANAFADKRSACWRCRLHWSQFCSGLAEWL